MKVFIWAGIFIILVLNLPAYAFTSVDEQIDYYLDILNDGTYETKIEILPRLQWSGLTAPRLYDEVEKNVFEGYLNLTLDKKGIGLLSHHIRALGYSGNEKYRDTLRFISTSEDKNRKIPDHAKKALSQLSNFNHWNKLIEDSNFSIEGKSVEVTHYMKMLSTEDVIVQRLAARGMYHEKQQDPDLLSLAAEKLVAMYQQVGLTDEEQDTAAWLCKAIGQSGQIEYKELLSKVAAKTPYKKIKKYAKKYAF